MNDTNLIYKTLEKYLKGGVVKTKLIDKLPKYKLASGGFLEMPSYEINSYPNILEKDKRPLSINWDGVKSNYNKVLNVNNMRFIDNYLKNKVTDNQRYVILSLIMEESGGNPDALDASKAFYGLLQWSNDRYDRNLDRKRTPQLKLTSLLLYIINTINNTTDSKSWTHGGAGSGYKRAIDAYNLWNDKKATTDKLMHAFTWGYVRPSDKLSRIKLSLANYNLLKNNLR